MDDGGAAFLVGIAGSLSYFYNANLTSSSPSHRVDLQKPLISQARTCFVSIILSLFRTNRINLPIMARKFFVGGNFKM